MELVPPERNFFHEAVILMNEDSVFIRKWITINSPNFKMLENKFSCIYIIKTDKNKFNKAMIIMDITIMLYFCANYLKKVD